MFPPRDPCARQMTSFGPGGDAYDCSACCRWEGKGVKNPSERWRWLLASMVSPTTTTMTQTQTMTYLDHVVLLRPAHRVVLPPRSVLCVLLLLLRLPLSSRSSRSLLSHAGHVSAPLRSAPLLPRMTASRTHRLPVRRHPSSSSMRVSERLSAIDPSLPHLLTRKKKRTRGDSPEIQISWQLTTARSHTHTRVLSQQHSGYRHHRRTRTRTRHDGGAMACCTRVERAKFAFVWPKWKHDFLPARPSPHFHGAR